MNEITPYPAKVTQDRKLTLRDILVIFFRRRWIVLAVSVPIIVFSVLGTMNTVDTYTASSQVLVEGLSTDSPTFRVNRGVEHDVMMSTAGQVASSTPVAEKAAAALMDSLQILQELDPRFAGVTGPDDFKGAILEGIHCSQVAESDILSINFSDHLPRFALMVVDAVTEAYVEFNAESKNNTGATQYYTEQVDQLQGEIDDLMSERAQVFEDGGINSFEINKTSSIQYMRQMEYQFLSARANREGMERRLAEIRREIAADKYFIPRATGSANAMLLGAFSDFNDARLQLEKLRLSYNDSSLFVVRQMEYVDKTEMVFLDARSMFVRNLEVELQELVEHENSLNASFEAYRKEIMQYPEIERRVASLDMEILAQRKLLEAMQVKRGEVRMEAESDLRVSNIVPLNVPQVVMGIGQGKRTIYLMLAAILAIVLGLVAAIFVDINDHKIYSRRQAEEVLEIPVLGSISEIRPARKS